MRKILLTILIVFLGLAMFAQEISFPSSIVAAGGSITDGNLVNLSRWRIGQVHVLTLQNPDTKEFEELDWNVHGYPNPVENVLHLEFELPETRELLLKVSDAAGRVIFLQEARSFSHGDITELNMSMHPPALYVLQISSPDLKSRRILRIQKL